MLYKAPSVFPTHVRMVPKLSRSLCDFSITPLPSEVALAVEAESSVVAVETVVAPAVVVVLLEMSLAVSLAVASPPLPSAEFGTSSLFVVEIG